MKLSIALLLLLAPLGAMAQSDTTYQPKLMPMAAYEPHTTVATLALGGIDQYRHDYYVSPNFRKDNATGFAPIFARIEYGVSKHISLAATVGYDAFDYNNSQLFTGSNGPFTRYSVNHTRILSGGLAAYYHLLRLVHIPNLDPFVGVGFALNNIHYSAYTLGDSTAERTEHTVTPYIKAGARYYVTQKVAVYGDVGYDQHTVFSIGASVRLVKTRYQPDADRDGIPDPADSCMMVKGIAKYHGCPDTDGDGIIDGADSCPRHAGKPALHGCPDTDGDGIADKDDRCPKQAGYRAFDGCPDSDGDGIADIDDGCPHEAGPADNHGCPVPTPVLPIKETPAPRQIVITEKPIQFETGSYTIRKQCYPTIDRIVALLKENPDVVVMVDGFADITGTDKINDRISKARAQAIAKVLKSRGIAADRIITTAHGSKQPIANNKTRTGRAQNRRVEVKVKP